MKLKITAVLKIAALPGYLRPSPDGIDSKKASDGYDRKGMPLRGHEYHYKTNEALRYIMKDASEAARALQGHDSAAEGKYLDQVNDAATVLHYRRMNGIVQPKLKPADYIPNNPIRIEGGVKGTYYPSGKCDICKERLADDAETVRMDDGNLLGHYECAVEAGYQQCEGCDEWYKPKDLVDGECFRCGRKS